MATIYYYTATGNSFEVARQMADKLGGAELQSLVPLASGAIAADDTIGIVFPVYDWSIPYVVRDFLERLDVSGTKYIFAIATCNFLPGYSLDKIKGILESKGKKLNAGFIVRMPGTYLPMYGANPVIIQSIKSAFKDKKTGLIARVVNNKRDRRLESSPLLFDKLMGPKMEKYMEEFPQMDQNFIVESACNGCGICAKVCPFGNIQMEGGKPSWNHNCAQCFACIHLCSKACIQIGDKTKGKVRYKNPVVPLKEIIRIAESNREKLVKAQNS